MAGKNSLSLPGTTQKKCGNGPGHRGRHSGGLHFFAPIGDSLSEAVILLLDLSRPRGRVILAAVPGARCHSLSLLVCKLLKNW